MIPLPAEVKECSQKSIRLTSSILIQLIVLLCKRLILHANMEICCSFKSFASGTFGYSYREDRRCISQVVPLRSCKKDISSYLQRSSQLILFCREPASSRRQKIWIILQFATFIDQISVPVLGGVVVLLVDVECLKKCTAMVKVGLSRFQMPIREWASVYHRQYARHLENSYSLATYHLVQNYAPRQTKVSIGNWSIGYQKQRQRQSFLYQCLSTLWASRRLASGGTRN